MCWRSDVVMMRYVSCRATLLTILLFTLAGCVSRSPTLVSVESIPPLLPAMCQAIKEEIWTASTLAQAEAEIYARQAMQEWMVRVRAKTENEFVPWYSGYWAQQRIGFKAGWYEMGREDGDAPVEDYLVGYLQEKFDELVLQPAGMQADPQMITAQAAALYVRLLSEQLRCLPKMHAVPPASLRIKLRQIPLITLSGSPPSGACLSQAFDHEDLAEVPAYVLLIARANSVENPESSSMKGERLQVVGYPAGGRAASAGSRQRGCTHRGRGPGAIHLRRRCRLECHLA